MLVLDRAYAHQLIAEFVPQAHQQAVNLAATLNADDIDEAAA